MPRYRVTIRGRDYDAMADLVRRYRVAVAMHTVRAQRGGGYRVQAFVDAEDLRALEAAGYRVERHEDTEAASRQRQAEVRNVRATRALVAGRPPGRYLDVDEIETALAALADRSNAAFTQLIKLPHKTWEGRTCHALKIGHGQDQERVGVYLLGGVHAREWGSPDILVRFADQLTSAYRTKKGLSIGQKKFTAAQIQALVNEKNVYVFPQANPDGRHHSMTVDASWRKNRRPAATAGPPECVGVDLNRNYGFLWDFPKYFDPQAPVSNSTDPCHYEVYIGPSAASEPETQNVIWLLDHDPQIRYFVDIHSYGEMILYNWGDDQDQIKDPAMNFRNPAYDGKRGRADDTSYREYIAADDHKAAVGLARHMQKAIAAVRDHTYTVEQSMGLYPTAGSADDYAFSRHLVDPAATKVHGFTVEWGSENNPTPFHPAYAEMSEIIREVTAGLLEFCRRAGS